MQTSNNTKHLLLVNTPYGFGLLPVTDNSPYVDGFYDPQRRVLVLYGREKKEAYHFLPKVNQYGESLADIVAVKDEQGKPKKDDKGQTIKEKRDLIERHKTVFSKEYYVSNPDDITAFLNLTAINADTFDFKQYLNGSVDALINQATAESEPENPSTGKLFALDAEETTSASI
jgi:hypothetical protein